MLSKPWLKPVEGDLAEALQQGHMRASGRAKPAFSH
jgi:hypothetical protein